MGKPKRTTNTRAATPTPTKKIFKNDKNSKIMKTKGIKLHIKNKKIKQNKKSIKEEEESEDDNIMTNNNFKEEVFGKLDVLKMERNIEDIKM